MRLSYQKKLLLICCLAFSALAIIGFLIFSDEELQRSFCPSASVVSPQKSIAIISAALKEIERQELAFALSGEKKAASSIRASSAVMHTHLAQLQLSFLENNDKQGDLLRIASLIDARADFAARVIEARNRGGKQAAEALLRNGNGGEISVQLMTILNNLELASSGTQGPSPASGQKSNLFGLIIAAFAVSMLFLVAIAFLTYKNRFPVTAAPEQKHSNQRSDSIPLFFDGFKDSAVFTLSADGVIAQWSESAERLYAFSATDAQDKPFSFLLPEKEVPLGKPEQSLKQAQQDGRSELVGWRRKKDGSLFLAHTIVVPLKGRSSELWGYSVLTRDITSIRQTEALLKKLALTVEQTADLIIITDRNGKVEFVNRAVEEVTGYTRGQIFAGGFDLLKGKDEDPGRFDELWNTVLSGVPYEAEITVATKSGELLNLNEMVTPIMEADGKVSHVVFTGTNITPIKLLRSRLDFLASYDALTGLPNRELFADRLRRDMSATPSGRTIAVLALDIDRFKYINEIYGLDAGNKILKQVAEGLSVSVDKGDTVGRMGSDEFGIVLHNVRRPADIVLFVKMIMKNVPQIIMSGGEEIVVTLTAGIAVYPTDGQEPAELMKNADTALAKAKTLGRNRYQFYTSDMNVGIHELVFMEQQLSEALRNKEYSLAFQPYCHLTTQKLAGAEALLKWKNEEFGQVSPTKFIPMLEETGMIIDVGKWVFDTACRQLKEWKNRNIALPVSVNLSLNQFRHEYLVETVQSAISDFGIDPRRLILEVTESTFMKDQPFAISVLTRLKALGVGISIDDFGTGYSSLSYLKKFPVDYIKIDQSFVKDVAADPDTTSLVTAIIAMAHSLNLITIAEGIETEEQWKILRLLKCDMGQGFFLSPALHPNELESFME